MTKFKDLFESKSTVRLFSGSEKEVQKRMNALFAHDEKNKYETQIADVVSFTDDYRTYHIEAENIEGYKKMKKIIDKIIKGK